MEPIRVDQVSTDSKIFAHSRWDAIPALAGVLHLVYFFALFYLFPRVPLWVSIPLGLIYSMSINWNINGVSHNFIHNPYFRSPLLNRLFAVIESISCCFSQTYYDVVHIQHHKGNSDRQDEKGETVDWISIYRHGHDGHAENPWAYTFLSFFRDTPVSVSKELRKRGDADLRWGKIEYAMVVIVMTTEFLFNWRFMIFYLLPFMYFGHCLSYLNGFYRHFGGNPDKPIAWGVSTYGKLYNWLFFYNGYHAEHHFRPKCHWTKMTALQQQIARLQKQEGVRVIKPPHFLGFLDPDLPPLQGSDTRASSPMEVTADA
jgi:fatty acid desaturase